VALVELRPLIWSAVAGELQYIEPDVGQAVHSAYLNEKFSGIDLGRLVAIWQRCLGGSVSVTGSGLIVIGAPG